MKIIFATLYDLNNINKGSGTYYHIYKELLAQNNKVTLFGPPTIKFPLFSRLFRFITKRILSKRYSSYMDPFVASVIGSWFQKRLKDIEYDILLTNDYAIAGYVKIEKPVVLWTDSIFPFNYSSNIHPWLKGMPWFAVEFCQTVVKRALKNTNMCFVPGEWNFSEIKKYKIMNSKKIKIIPFGSNLADPGPEISKKRKFQYIIKRNEIRLLFVGKDWELKGGEIAIEIVNELNYNGYKAILNVVGSNCNTKNDFVINHGYLDKDKNRELKRLKTIYNESDVFVLPSIAEGFGISYIEAASYGLPSLGYFTQGVTTSVENRVSGRLLPLKSRAIDFVKIIESWYVSPHIYDGLVKGARNHFQYNCNWENSIKNFTDSIKEVN